MKHGISLAALLLTASPAFAGPTWKQFNEAIKMQYLYGFTLGYLTADCVAYQQGEISKNRMIGSFQLVMDEDLTDFQKQKIIGAMKPECKAFLD